VEIPNNKFQIPNKKTIAHAAQAPALRVEPVWNLMLETCPLVLCNGRRVYLEFGTWNF
jgi:hypothetical protein